MRWLEEYDNVVRGWGLATKNSTEKVPRVKVALVGLGYDDQHAWLRGKLWRGNRRIKSTRNWLDGEGNDVDGVRFDEEGFGTHCVASLMRMAPMAELYVAQVVNDVRLDGLGDENLAKSIAKVSGGAQQYIVSQQI
jgi:hypothetical protein